MQLIRLTIYGYPFNEYLYRKASWIRCLENTASPLPINPLKMRSFIFICALIHIGLCISRTFSKNVVMCHFHAL